MYHQNSIKYVHYESIFQLHPIKINIIEISQIVPSFLSQANEKDSLYFLHFKTANALLEQLNYQPLHERNKFKNL